MSIGDQQIQLIYKAKTFLKRLNSSNIDSSLSSFCFFASFTETPGYAKLKYWLNGWSFSFSFCKILLKNILAIASETKYVEFANYNTSNNYDTIILSWCYKKNFQSDGSFNDRYFKENSKDFPNAYWILIAIDDFSPPKNLKSNIKIIKSEKSFFKYNFFSFIKIIFSTILKYKFSPRKIFHYLYYSSYLARIMSSIVKKELKKNSYKTVLMPYEAQNFQNKVFFEVKKFNKQIKTIGYVHSITALTSELIYRSGAPDLLLVHGDSQIEILKSQLDWPEDRLKLTPSFAYRVGGENYSSNKIFLPSILMKTDILLNEFEKLIKNYPKKSLPVFNIQNHPLALSSKKHLDFVKKLEKILEAHKDHFLNNSFNKKMSLFFGVTDPLEALENGASIIHICSDPVLESYSEKIWQNIKVKQLSSFTFQYNVLYPGKYIIFGKKKYILNETLKNLY